MISLLTQILVALLLLAAATVPAAPLVALAGGRRAVPVALLPAACFAVTLVVITAALVPVLWNGWALEFVVLGLIAVWIVGSIVLKRRCANRREALREIVAVTPIGVARDLPWSLRIIALVSSVWAFLLGGWLDDGDMLAHTSIARKLAELREPTFANINYFVDGSLHPGYPAPPWHALVALVSSLTTADVATVMWVAAAVMAPIAALTAAGLAQVVFRARIAGVVAGIAFLATDGLARAPLFGAVAGANSPNAIATQILMPLCIACFMAALWHPVERGRRGAFLLLILAAVPALTALHASYLSFLGITVGAYLLVGFLHIVRRPTLVRRHAIVAASLLGVTVAGLLALRPSLSKLVTFRPEAAAAALKTEVAEYAGIVVGSVASFHLRIDMLTWFGGIVGAGLISALLAVRRPREPGAWFILGATAVVVLMSQVNVLFTKFSSIVSLHQSKRMQFILPTELGLTLAALFVAAACGRWRLRNMRLIPILLAAVVGLAWAVLVEYWPQVTNFKAGPDMPLLPLQIVAWASVPAALYVALVGRRAARPVSTKAADERNPAGLGFDPTRPMIDVRGGAEVWAVLVIVLATLPLLPAAARSIIHLDRPSSALHAYSLAPLDGGAIKGLRDLPPRTVVLAPPHPWALRVQAVAPVYVVGVRVIHVARTEANRPVARRDAALKFLAPGASNADRVKVLREHKVGAVFLPEGYAVGAPEAFLDRYPRVFSRITPEGSRQGVWEVRQEELGRIPLVVEPEL